MRIRVAGAFALTIKQRFASVTLTGLGQSLSPPSGQLVRISARVSHELRPTDKMEDEQNFVEFLKHENHKFVLTITHLRRLLVQPRSLGAGIS